MFFACKIRMFKLTVVAPRLRRFHAQNEFRGRPEKKFVIASVMAREKNLCTARMWAKKCVL